MDIHTVDLNYPADLGDIAKLQRAVDGLQRDVIGLTRIMQRVVERLERLERCPAVESDVLKNRN